MELIYDLEKRGKLPLYEYLYLCIREDVLNGTLRPGEKLPSKRELARSHDVALITVENAYAQLIIEGYVTAREKSGYFVNPGMAEDKKRSDMAGRGETKRDGVRNVETNRDVTVQGEGLRGGVGRKDAAVSLTAKPGTPRGASSGKWLVDFTSGELKKDAFPFSVWAKLMRRVMNDREEAFLTKPENRGVPELREAIREYLKKAKGLSVLPEQIVVGPGTEYLHHVLLQLLGRSRIVAVEDPGYKKVGQIYEGNGLKCLHVPVDQGGMIVERLKGSNATLVHISPSHHFPTGCVMPIARRRELLSWARESGAYVIEDDYDSEFRFDGRPIPTLVSLDGDRVIYMNTFTKTLAPSIRIAYAVLPPELTERYGQKLSYYSGAVSSFEQYTLAAFIGEGYYERHVARMRNYYRQQRAKILTALAQSPLAKRASVEEHAAGLHFILRISGIKDEGKWLARLEGQGIRLMPVSAFCYERKENYRHRFVIYYSDIDPENLKEAFEIMAKEK